MNILEKRVLQLIGEDPGDPDVFTDDSTGMAQIRSSLNDAIEEICLITGSHKRKHHVPIESGKNFYQISNDRDYFAWPTSVWLTGQKRRLEQVDLNWLVNYNYRWMYETGTPERYFIIGENKLGVHPRPGGSNYMLEIDSVVIPEAYTLDTDRIKLRDSFQYAAVHFAVSEYWASVGDARTATDHFKTYLDRIGLQDLYQDSHERVWVKATVKDDQVERI